MRERNFTPRRPGKRPYRGRPKTGPRRVLPSGPGEPKLTAADDAVVLFGWHTVKAALENPRRHIRRLLATENAARRLAEDGTALPSPPEIVRPDAIASRLGPDSVHNGLLAEADPLPALELDDIAADGIVLVLDQITDPHNVG